MHDMEGYMQNRYLLLIFLLVTGSSECSEKKISKPTSSEIAQKNTAILLTTHNKWHASTQQKHRKPTRQEVLASIPNYDDYSPPGFCLRLARWLCGV